LKSPPSVFISASAVGFYGNRGEELLNEKSASGAGFLPKVCREWESASEALQSVGTRVVHARFGLVIGNGGLVKKSLPLFKLGLGGPIGSGEQWQSWIALVDLVRALDFCIEQPSIEGAVNLVSPNAVRQKEFAAILAKSVHRPAFLRVPAFILRAVFGEMAEEVLLSSQHVLPKKLQNGHFSFLMPKLEDAICQ